MITCWETRLNPASWNLVTQLLTETIPIGFACSWQHIINTPASGYIILDSLNAAPIWCIFMPIIPSQHVSQANPEFTLKQTSRIPKFGIQDPPHWISVLSLVCQLATYIYTFFCAASKWYSLRTPRNKKLPSIVGPDSNKDLMSDCVPWLGGRTRRSIPALKSPLLSDCAVFLSLPLQLILPMV